MAETISRWPQAGASPPATVRYGFVVLLALAAAAVVAFALLSERLDHQQAFLLSAPTAAGATLLAIIWLCLTSPRSWRARLLRLGVFGLLIGAMLGLVRVEETSGDVVPKLAWRFRPRHDVALAAAGVDLGSGRADLSATTPDDYAEFLGPGRRATVAGPELARDWGTHPPQELWRHAIGAGWGSFAIVGNYAVTQEQRGDGEMVVCYELDTGKPVWHYAHQARFEHPIAGIGPRETPTIVDGRVYASGALGTLVCLDGADGTLLWQHDVSAENGADTPELTPEWGRSCSPLVVDDAVIVTAGGPQGHSLVAYHRVTGDVLWSAGDDRASYSSPQLAELAGVRQVVIVNRDSVVGHDPVDGHTLWRYEWPGESAKCAQPLVVGDDCVLVSAGYGVGSRLLQVARDDQNQFTVEQKWPSSNFTKLRSKFANMILLGDRVYGLDDGILTCVEAAKGRRLWKDGRYGHGQLLLVGKMLLVQAESGELMLIEPHPQRLIELGRITALAGKTWNNQAISGNKLLLRNHEEAVCYEMPVLKK